MGYQFSINGRRTNDIPVADALSRNPSEVLSAHDREAEKLVSIHLVDVRDRLSSLGIDFVRDGHLVSGGR
jgi:hypothetical protein